MKCERITRKNSNLPPFNASKCFNMKKKGKDGMYISTDRNNGVLYWKKIKGKAPI